MPYQTAQISQEPYKQSPHRRLVILLVLLLITILGALFWLYRGKVQQAVHQELKTMPLQSEVLNDDLRELKTRYATCLVLNLSANETFCKDGLSQIITVQEKLTNARIEDAAAMEAVIHEHAWAASGSDKRLVARNTAVANAPEIARLDKALTEYYWLVRDLRTLGKQAAAELKKACLKQEKELRTSRTQISVANIGGYLESLETFCDAHITEETIAASDLITSQEEAVSKRIISVTLELIAAGAIQQDYMKTNNYDAIVY